MLVNEMFDTSMIILNEFEFVYTTSIYMYWFDDGWDLIYCGSYLVGETTFSSNYVLSQQSKAQINHMYW